MTTEDRPLVLVGMPHYGAVEAGASQGFYCPTRGSVRIANCVAMSASNTGASFNDILVEALAGRDAGEFTHFAMIHADIEPRFAPYPEPLWLDWLWSEMTRHQADFMSAVVPIKDVSNPFDPPTSTGIGDLDDPWKAKRLFRVSDRKNLPLTFGQADVCGEGEVLLVNTGLWLADLRHPAWDAFAGFSLHNRIVRDPDGSRRGQQRSEDWDLSRHLHAHGAKVMATWAVDLTHRGTFGWRNRPVDPT